MPHVLIAEENVISAKLTAFILTDAGYKVSIVTNGYSAIETIARDAPDLLLLDTHLPALSGFDVCQEVRRTTYMPIIFLSSAGTLADRVQGLSSGADDYIVKPFSSSELLARIAAVLRRYDSVQKQQPSTLARGPMLLDPVKRLVSFNNDRTVDLTPIEAQILYILMMYAGQVVSDRTLLQSVWGQNPKGRNLLTVYVYRLRMKLWPAHPESAPIVTLRGQGYMFIEPTSEGQIREVGESR
ncbi:MAG TPA: response regulator transcription factor [Kouleothrix sp.]|jgi:DNA-binding response OmpR family regulator|nr:response regulator transcription factor [Kouleothrix sp.]